MRTSFCEADRAALSRDLEEAREAGAWTFAALLDEEGRAIVRTGRAARPADTLAALSAAALAAYRERVRLPGLVEGELHVVRLRGGPGLSLVLACLAGQAVLAVEHDLVRTTHEEAARVVGVVAGRLLPTLHCGFDGCGRG